MPITKEEAQAAIDLYDYAMSTGEIDALLELLDLFTKATCGDYNAEGLAWAIICAVDRRKAQAHKDQQNKKSESNKAEQ